MPAIVMRDYRGQHELTIDGRVISEGKCDIHLDDEFLLIKGPRVLRIPYDEVESIHGAGLTVEFHLHPAGVVRLHGLDGTLVRPLYLHASRLRGTRWADLLRFVEGEVLDALECKVVFDGGEEGEALVRLYPAGVVVLSLGGDPVQLLLHEMETIRLENYRLRCATPHLAATFFGCEPGDLGRFHRSIVGARQGLEEETASLLAELFPALEFAQATRVTDLLLRGKAAAKRDIDAIVPWLWGRIEGLIRERKGSGEAYEHLRGLAGDRLWFGLRRLTEKEKTESAEPPADEVPEEAVPPEGQEPEASWDYLLWFMAGIVSEGRRFVVVEVVAPGEGFATYVYRTVEPPSGEDPFDTTGEILSRSFVALNFHREPLYAPQAEIDTGKFARYKLALRKLDYLRTARSLFVGRAIHTKGWKSSLQKLIS